MIAIVLTMLKMLPVGDKVPPQALAIVPTARANLPQRMRARLAETEGAPGREHTLLIF